VGRPVYYRQRIINQARSVQAKTLLNHMASEIRARREISTEEAQLIALDALRYLEKELLILSPGQVEMPLIEGLTSHFRQPRSGQAEKMVNLTILSDEDAQLLEEFGTRVMQQNRLARLIEEAYLKEAMLDGNRLCLLMPLTLVALRERLKPLWEMGVTLPLAGLTKKTRAKMNTHRPVLAIKRYLEGEELKQIRLELAISKLSWSKWWQSFQETVLFDNEKSETLADHLDLPTYIISGFKEIYSTLKDSPFLKERLGKLKATTKTLDTIDEQDRLEKKLLSDHGYSLASAKLFMQELRDLALSLKQSGRQPGQIITFGVAADEPPGRSLSEAHLKLVRLDYISADDWSLVMRTSAADLKWQRLMRLCTQSYEQGVALSLADLAHLLGISVDGVQKSIKKHDDVILPTRGRVADMGSTLSHSEKIISLYMDGYTETEIKRRTGHSYDSIERYIFDFARVTCLQERGMPVNLIRQALSMSKRVVTKYLELYERFNAPDFSFRMARIRKMIDGLEDLKKNGR
jgi:hypothetical protein